MSHITIYESQPDKNKTLPAKASAYLNSIQNPYIKILISIMASHRSTCFLVSQKLMIKLFEGQNLEPGWYSTLRKDMRGFGSFAEKNNKTDASLFILKKEIQRKLGMDHTRHLTCLQKADEFLNETTTTKKGEQTVEQLKQKISELENALKKANEVIEQIKNHTPTTSTPTQQQSPSPSVTTEQQQSPTQTIELLTAVGDHNTAAIHDLGNVANLIEPLNLKEYFYTTNKNYSSAQVIEKFNKNVSAGLETTMGVYGIKKQTGEKLFFKIISIPSHNLKIEIS